MDTRSKIVPPECFSQWMKTGEWVVVAGFFDPLTAAQANRLAAVRERGRKVAAIVLSDPHALFGDDARATLIASLRDVHAVTVASPENWRSLIEGAEVEVIEDAAADRARTAEFVRLVLARTHAE